MSKIWFYTLFYFLIFFISYIITQYNIITYFFIYSEIFFIFLFFFNINNISFFNDSRYLVLSIFLLYLATLELIIISLYFLFKIK